MEEDYIRIMKFINDEDYHSEDETGGSAISVGTLKSFFNVFYKAIPKDKEYKELQKFFKLNN